MTYKLIGQRNLRKYTEPKTSPTYAAAIEAQTIVDSLCGVTWKKVSAKDATMTYHTEETVGEIDGQKIGGLDMNVRIRDQFDAALFCAGHSGGQHRAYANAAVYHYVLPDGTLPKLTKLTANVTSDPYNSAGARIAILTNATGEIPTNCNECRTGDAHADGVAPRTIAANGNWFPTMSDCVFSATPGEGETALPSGGLQLQKHLFVFVLMESYSTVRGNWLEGCSFIRNLIQIETDAAVPGWTDGKIYDLSDPDGAWYCAFRRTSAGDSVERLFRVAPDSLVKFNNKSDEDVPENYLVEQSGLKTKFGSIEISGLKLVQKNIVGSQFVDVKGDNCLFADPDYINTEYSKLVELNRDIIEHAMRSCAHFTPNEHDDLAKYNASGTLVDVSAFIDIQTIGGDRITYLLDALMDEESGEIFKMCCVIPKASYDLSKTMLPYSDFEPIDFPKLETSIPGQIFQDHQGRVARMHKLSGSSTHADVIEVGSKIGGRIESCSIVDPIDATPDLHLGGARLFAGSKVDFNDGDKLFNHIFVANPLSIDGADTSQSFLPISDVVRPLFGRDYNLVLDDYRNLSACMENVHIRTGFSHLNDTMLIAGDFTIVNGVETPSGWAILRMNQRTVDGELVTDYVNVIPMNLPRLKCVRIRSVEISNVNMKSLVALGIIE